MKKKLSLKRVFGRTFTFPGIGTLSDAARHFSSRERLLFGFLAVVLAISTVTLLAQVNELYLTEVPVAGGTLTEGVVGTPFAINPVRAANAADLDLVALVYSGLMRPGPGGKLIYDLAESYTVSDDGLTYTFTLRNDLVWHDGLPLTSEDVVFTIEKVQESAIESPHLASWDGVTASATDERTIVFELPEPYSPFLVNTTLGIIPQHLWSDITPGEFKQSFYNTEPIGSGPYKLTSVKRNSKGIPVAYDLNRFDEFALGQPMIDEVRIRVYSNEVELVGAYLDGSVDSIHGISTQQASDIASTSPSHRLETLPLPRVIGAFFNQNQAAIFTDLAVRKALERVIDRDAIVEKALDGYGEPISGPIPETSLGFTPYQKSASTSAENVASAISLLERNGWAINDETGYRENDGEVLSFAISAPDVPELMTTAFELETAWESLGADVEVKIFEAGNLVDMVIRPRKYDIVLYGEIVGRDSDLFAFWHSSQRMDPGLNIALYTNLDVDAALTKARTSTSTEERDELNKEVAAWIQDEVPAVFIYTPHLIYPTSYRVRGIYTGPVTTPSERFMDIYTWYVETERVWEIFAR